MGTIIPSRTTPLLVPHLARVRNGLEPDCRTATAIALRHAWTLAYARKNVFTMHTRPSNLPQGQSGTTTQWRWLCRTGNEGSSSGVTLRARLGLLPGTNSAGADPKVRMSVYDGTTTTNSDYASYWTSSSFTPGLDDILWTYVECAELDEDTQYQCRFESVDYCRIVSANVYEVVSTSLDDTRSNVTNTGYFSGRDIDDAQHSEITEHGHAYWRHNGAHLANIVPEWPGLAKFTTSSTTYANLLGGSTTPAANTPGVVLSVQYHNPVHTNNVACVFGVFGSQNVGTGGDVRLIDTNSTTLGTISNLTTTGAWHTTTVNLDGSVGTHKVDVHFRASSGNTLTVEAASLFEYVT